MIKTLDVEELAVILHNTVDTIYEYRRTRPQSIPPCLKIEGISYYGLNLLSRSG